MFGTEISINDFDDDKVYLDEDGIEQVAAAVPDNSNIKRIYINRVDAISAREETAISSIIEKSPRLEEFSMQDCDFGDIPEAPEIPLALENCGYLQSVIFDECSFEGGRLDAFADFLRGNTSLKRLELCSSNGPNEEYNEATTMLTASAIKGNNSIKELILFNLHIGSGHIEEIAKAVIQSTSLNILDLRGNDIGAEGAKVLERVFAKKTSLTVLKLSDNGINDAGASAIASLLTSNSGLSEIDLRYNDINAEGARALANAISDNMSLKRLDVSYNNIGNSGAVALLKSLCTSNHSLKILNVAGNNIGDEGLIALAPLLESSGLSEIDLQSNGINAEGAGALANAISDNTPLKRLDISYNNVGNSGAVALLKSLCNNSNHSLEVLNIASINIGDNGLIALAPLTSNSGLEEIDLQSNGIKVEGATALANAISELTSLVELNISGNKIGDAGATALFESLGARNHSLEVLNVACNDIGNDGFIALSSLLESNTTITKIFAYGNDMGAEGVESFTTAIAKNRTLQEFTVDGKFDQHLNIFKKALYNDTSIEAVLSSNHALRCFGYGSPQFNEGLRPLLLLNKEGPEKAVGEKVDRFLKERPHYGLSQAVEDNLIPMVLTKVGRDCSLSAMYRLIRNMPELTDTSHPQGEMTLASHHRTKTSVRAFSGASVGACVGSFVEEASLETLACALVGLFLSGALVGYFSF